LAKDRYRGRCALPGVRRDRHEGSAGVRDWVRPPETVTTWSFHRVQRVHLRMTLWWHRSKAAWAADRSRSRLADCRWHQDFQFSSSLFVYIARVLNDSRPRGSLADVALSCGRLHPVARREWHPGWQPPESGSGGGYRASREPEGRLRGYRHV